MAPYTPLQFVNNFLEGLVLFDQRGKFPVSTKKALDNSHYFADEENQNAISCWQLSRPAARENILNALNFCKHSKNSRRWRAAELVVQLSEGHTLRYMLEEDCPPELIEQRLTQEFVSRFVTKYAAMATSGFLDHIC